MEQVAIVSGGNNRTSLSLNGASLFFTIYHNGNPPTGSVHSAPVAGGAAAQVGSDPSDGAVSDGIHVYWSAQGIGASTNGRIRRRLLSGGSVENFATGQNWPRGVAADATAVYWVNFNGGEVMKQLK